jgi:4,5-DOPA dioxygenase extradiol
MNLFPALFIGHGSPMNIIEDNDYTKALKKMAAELPKPKAVLVVSAHWLTKGTFITSNVEPRQIYDFYGFPEDLYKIKYVPSGLPSLAKNIENNSKVKPVVSTESWGLDHAAWAVLVHMYPNADVPVLELSIDMNQPPAYHFELGQMLGKLREQEILVIGSGNLVHNLRNISFDENAIPFDWALGADEELKKLISHEQIEALLSFPVSSTIGKLAAPTTDHYYPMLYVLGMKRANESITYTFEGFQNGSISMRCFKIS